MRFFTLFSLYAALGAASPLPQGTGSGADSCPSDPLETKTWTDLGVDKFLDGWIKANYSGPSSGSKNAIQALSDSFGAPNFVCGIDAFCNAGQPCLPISLPGWYVMVAVQNWNNYMNSINTAVNFASSIMSLSLPGIVSDFIQDPKDDVTPLVGLAKVFVSMVGAVPLTGALDIAKSGVTAGANFLLTQVKPPQPTDKFVQWSNVAGTLSGIVSDFQASIADASTRIIQAAPDDSSSGIAGVLNGGGFLGVSQNFTQSDLAKGVSDAMTRFAVGQAVAASGIFVLKFHGAQPCLDDDVSVCVPDGSSNYNVVLKQSNWDEAFDAAGKLRDKYGMVKEDYTTRVLDCWEKQGQKTVNNPFGDGTVPLDKGAECVFNIPVCDLVPGTLEPGSDDYSDHCNKYIARTRG